MVGLIGDRLRRWLDGSSKPTAATGAAANGKRRGQTEMDDANAGTNSTQDGIPTPAGPAAAEAQASQVGQAQEVNDED
jgi:hypothetical protein